MASAAISQYPLRTCTLLLSLLLFAASFPSCGVTDYMSAYFNTYYNAQRLYDEAEADVFQQLDQKPTGRNWLLPFGIQAATKTKFASVIEKCSKLLQYHPESSLVDDALMMIGKAYYYSDDNPQAERKFIEIISDYPKGARALEARLLLSFAQYRMNRREDADKTARNVIEIAEKQGEPEMISRASMVLGTMAEEDRNYSGAREFFERAAEAGGTAEQRTSAFMRAAEMYVRLESYAEAEQAYKKASKASDTYVGQYRGQIGALRMVRKEGKYSDALAGLRLLRSINKNKEFFAEIQYEIANTYRDMGDGARAITEYTIVDTTYPHTEYSARSYLSRGALYERTFFRYDSALVSYSKGKTEFVSNEIVPICAQRADYLTRYFQLHNEYAFYDSARLALIAQSDSTQRGGLRDTTLLPRDTLRSAEPPREEAPRPAESSRETPHAGLGGRDSVRSPLVPIMPHVLVTLDSADVHLSRSENELGGLFYATIGLPDSAEYWYHRVVEDFPSSPYVPRALFTMAQIYFGRDSVVYKTTVDSLHRMILDRYPLSEFAPESRRLLGLPPLEITRDSAEVHYSEAEKLMLAGDTTKAADSFKDVAQKYPSSPFASRALYAAGWVYEYQMLNVDSAIASYERLLALYPRSTYASRITGKIAEVMMKRKSAAAPDSSAARRAGPALGPQAPGQQGGLLKAPVPAVPDSAIQRGLPRKGKEGPSPE